MNNYPNVHILDHPLIRHKVAIIRDKNTSTKQFREVIGEIATLMAFEAFKEVPTQKIVVETPQLDEDGNVVMKKKKPVADKSKRDTENVPLAEDIDAYFEREVLPYNPQAWIDTSKTKIGYEIPFTRTFYEYKQIEPSDVIAARIEEHEKSLMAKLHDLFGEG